MRSILSSWPARISATSRSTREVGLNIGGLVGAVDAVDRRVVSFDGVTSIGVLFVDELASSLAIVELAQTCAAVCPALFSQRRSCRPPLSTSSATSSTYWCMTARWSAVSPRVLPVVNVADDGAT